MINQDVGSTYPILTSELNGKTISHMYYCYTDDNTMKHYVIVFTDESRLEFSSEHYIRDLEMQYINAEGEYGR